MEGILTMSHKEADRLKIIAQVESRSMTIEEASELLEVSKRQMFRLLKKVREEGSRGVIHKLRGKSSNRGYPKELKKKVIGIYRKSYYDYGPTLFLEELIKSHKISLSRETIRQWLRENAITTSMRKKRPHRKKRQRRTSFGSLVQFDGSIHDWFEGRGPECCLLVCVDDATGRVHLRFSQSENTQDAMLTMWEYVKLYGIPRSIYTDRGGVYREEAGHLTDFGRAMKELGVELIFARSPQAKGRVERFNRTLQDRLVKALRQKGINNIAQANRFLQKSFIKSFNDKFSVNPEVPDGHRPIDGLDLKNIFCYKTQRQVRNDYTINLSGSYIQLLKSEAPLPRPKQSVTVCKWLNGEVHIYFNHQELKFTLLKEKPKKKGYKIHHIPKDHPWRRANEKMKLDKQRNYLLAQL
ncbi:MAG: ISNCY family transposase [Ignavibacteria bacterium]|jgi:transposase-like protein|nr:ISNCY family transposase [Ignavibacteria bacterium]